MRVTHGLRALPSRVVWIGLGCWIAALASDSPAEAKPKKAQVQAVTASGPTLKYEQFRRGVEIQVASKREEQVSGLLKLLELGPKEDEIPDIKFRLAELYYEKSRFFFFRAQEADDKLIKASGPEKKSLEAEKVQNTQASEKWVRLALELYKEIRERYPNYPRMPEVLFALGQSYWNDGKYDDAMESYGDLIKRFQDSPLVADAWLAFGEFYFNDAKLQKAIKAYELAAADKRSRVYGFALYKQAWCYYNLADWNKALSKFRATIFYSQMSAELSGENRISLAREAQKDFVRTYTHVGDAKRAKFVFAEITGGETCKEEFCLRLLEILADLWFSEGSFEEAAYIYKQLIELNPKSTRSAFFQAKIIDLVSRARDRRRVIQESRHLIEIVDQVRKTVESGSLKGEKLEKAKEDLEEGTTLAESTIRKLAQLWNREAQKTRQAQTYADARTMYDDYLRLFPSSKFAYEMRFQLGDLFYKLEEFDKAAQAYEATVNADPKGKFLIDAANDNILALEELMRDAKLPKLATNSKDKIPIHPMRQRLIDACDRYVKLVPRDKAEKIESVQFKAAKMFYDHNEFEEAIRRFELIITEAPATPPAEIAANLVVDVYNFREDWKALYEASARYLGNEALLKDRDKLRTDLRKFSEYGKFKLVQDLEKELKAANDPLGPVAKAYEEFQAEFPESENADKALFNASVVWDSVGEKARAEELRSRLMTQYKNSPLRADVQYYTAKSFEQRTDFERAAELFVDFARQYEKDARARDALFNAAVFYAGVGKVTKANTLREEYLKRYGKQKGAEREAADLYFTMATDLDRAGKLTVTANAYREFVKQFPNDKNTFEAMWREASIRRRIRQGGEADKIEDTIYKRYRYLKRNKRELPQSAADYASRIGFKRVDEEWPYYRKMRIAQPSLNNPEHFQRSLEEKAKARDVLMKKYTQVVTEYQQAYSTIAALRRIAMVWDSFVEAMLNIRCPRALNEEQCGFFKQGLEEKIEPARQAALLAYRTCVEKSSELGAFTDDSSECVKALEKVAPDNFPAIAERLVPLSQDKAGLNLSANGLLLKAVSAPEARAVGALDKDAKEAGL